MATELELLVAVGAAVVGVYGPQSPQNEQHYERAHLLVEKLNSRANRFPVLWNLWYVVFTRVQLEAALLAAMRLVDAAAASGDEVELLEAEHAMWPTLTAMGRPLQAVVHAEKGLAMYSPERHAGQRFVYGGHDPGVCGLYHLAMALWLSGAPDRALRRLGEAERLAARLAHPTTNVLLGYFGGWVRYQRGELEEAISLFAMGEDTAKRSGNVRYKDVTTPLLRCLRREQLDLAQLDGMRDTLTRLSWHSWQTVLCICLLAETYVRFDHLQQGIALVRALRQEGIQSCMTPELSRLEAEWLARTAAPNMATAIECAREAIATAASQRALSLELRATTTLARLLASTGKRTEARMALEAVYGRFTEGFGTADLKAAKALLAELA